MRTIRRVLWTLVVVVALLSGAVWFGASFTPVAFVPAADDGSASAQIGGEFSLIGHDGQPRTWADFRGKPTAVFFGFTHCPEICPTTLGALSVLLSDLGTAGDRLNVILITVDPERDTPDVLVQYMSSFDERILALTGTEEQVANAASAFKAFRQKVPLEDNDYTYDHTAAVLLFRPDGSFAGTLDRHDTPENQMAKIRRLLDA